MRINYHEHAFQVSELLKGDELDKIENSIKEFKDLYESGFEGYVDATPLFLGRNIEGLATLIERTNLKVFPVTGFHHSGHYAKDLREQIMSKGLDFWVEKISSEINLGMSYNENSFLNGDVTNYSKIRARVSCVLSCSSVYLMKRPSLKGEKEAVYLISFPCTVKRSVGSL